MARNPFKTIRAISTGSTWVSDWVGNSAGWETYSSVVIWRGGRAEAGCSRQPRTTAPTRPSTATGDLVAERQTFFSNLHIDRSSLQRGVVPALALPASKFTLATYTIVGHTNPPHNIILSSRTSFFKKIAGGVHPKTALRPLVLKFCLLPLSLTEPFKLLFIRKLCTSGVC